MTSALILVTSAGGLLSPGLQATAVAVAEPGDLLLVTPGTRQASMSRPAPESRSVVCFTGAAGVLRLPFALSRPGR